MVLEFSSFQHRQLSHLCISPFRLELGHFGNRARFVLPSPSTSPRYLFIQHVRPLTTLEMASTKAEVCSTTEELNLSEHYDLLQSIYKIPGIDKAWLLPSQKGHSLDAMVAMSEVNLVANSKRKYMSFVNIPKTQEKETSCNWSAFPFELTGVSHLVPSMSGQKLLVIRNADTAAKTGSSPTKLEVWSSAQLVKEILVPAATHGSVYADGWFEGVSWSHDESHIAYIAEEPSPGKPVFEKTHVSSSPRANDKDVYSWKGQGDWEDDWGESYTGKCRPCLFVADLQNGSVQKVDGVPDDLSVGQVVWAPGDSLLLIFVGWQSASTNFKTCRKLGIKYCFNRPCALYAVQAFQEERTSDSPNSLNSLWNLTSSINSAFLPRFSQNGKLLLFLSAQGAVSTGVHNGTNSLHILKWQGHGTLNSGLEIREVVSVAQPKGKFPGLYCQSMIASPWLLDNQTILLSSPWYSIQVILAVDTERGDAFKITPDNDSASWSILSLHDDYILAARSSFGKPHSLKLGVPRSSPGAKSWDWFDVCNPHLKLPDKVQSVLSTISCDIMRINVPNHEGFEQQYEAIFVASTGNDSQERRPLVVMVHGGPHSSYTTSFSKAYAFLLGLGLNLLLVNYRGSLGYGEETLQSLPGKAGHQDVADVLGALDLAISKGLADSGRVAVLGGSHGGFLSAHLIGQAPDRFVTAAIINPVCNISSMVGTTDIPDWCFVETYGKAGLEAYSDAPSPQDLEKFFCASPISHIAKVKVPSLFLLGAQDRRVPISNGFQYVHALRARGLKVKAIVFPEDAHPIDRPQSEFECWLNIGTWLKHYLDIKGKDPA